jgi:N-acetylglucosaminylphosphatidylinositol deacetylase
MFFLPTIRALQQTSKICLLCMTTGNFAGLGKTRMLELEAVAKELRLDKLSVVDDETLPDHMALRWNIDYAEKVMTKSLEEALSIERKNFNGVPVEYQDIQVITFDWQGVSRHPNHIDTFLAVRQFCKSQKYPLWSLKTVSNPLLKYIPVCEWLMLLRVRVQSMLYMAGWTDTQPLRIVTTNYKSAISHHLFDPSCNWQCMALHASQFVWYRRLFVIFSCYTFVNRLERVVASTDKLTKKRT